MDASTIWPDLPLPRVLILLALRVPIAFALGQCGHDRPPSLSSRFRTAPLLPRTCHPRDHVDGVLENSFD